MIRETYAEGALPFTVENHSPRRTDQEKLTNLGSLGVPSALIPFALKRCSM